ncbi:MAG: hypothetical protein U0354_16930 [Candidatus Sericytochromatia bacterium]
MKSKLLFGFMLISVMASGCDNSSKIKYTLKDTWGADGNWGNKTKVASSNPSKEINNKSNDKVVVNKTSPSENKVEKKIEQNTKNIATATKEDNPKNNKVAENKTTKPVFKWEKVPATGILKANYVKTIPNDNLSFSYAVINNTNIDSKFKTDYKNKLTKAIQGISIVSDKDEKVNNKNSWVLAFTYDKDSTKVKQKQVFIPVNKNLMIANFIASEKGFNSVEDEFKTITKHLKL